MSWKDKLMDGFSYPLTIESMSKKRKKDSTRVVVVDAPFDVNNVRKGSLRENRLSLPEGEVDIAHVAGCIELCLCDVDQVLCPYVLLLNLLFIY
jgi:hypothetical protein